MTTFDEVNVYVYAPRLLYISWGIAILYALFAVAVGFLSLIKNGYSYSNNFSTVLRTTRHVELDTLLVPDAKTGADPLPKSLAKRAITIKSHMGADSDSFESENGHGYVKSEQEGTQAGIGKPLMDMSENSVRT